MSDQPSPDVEESDRKLWRVLMPLYLVELASSVPIYLHSRSEGYSKATAISVAVICALAAPYLTAAAVLKLGDEGVSEAGIRVAMWVVLISWCTGIGWLWSRS